MKKIYLLAMAACIAAAAIPASAKPHRGMPSRPSASAIRNYVKPEIKKAPTEGEIIYDQPEGELSLLTKNCFGYYYYGFESVGENVAGSVVKMVKGDDGIYLSNIIAGYPCPTWVKAESDGTTLSIKGVQPFYEDWDDYGDEITVYIAPLKVEMTSEDTGTFVVVEDGSFDFTIGEDGSIVAKDPAMMLGVCTYGENADTGKEGYFWGGIGDTNIAMRLQKDEVIVPPAGTEPETWVWIDGTGTYDPIFAKVIVAGNDFYIAGLDPYLKNAWAKGEIAGNEVKFKSGQYLGADLENGYFNYLCGADVEIVTDEFTEEERIKATVLPEAVFSYDAAGKKLTLKGAYIIDPTPEYIYPVCAVNSITVEWQNRNVKAVPQNPFDLVYDDDPMLGKKIWVQIPALDVDGNLLDSEKLYYEVYIDGELLTLNTDAYFDLPEDMTEIPYNLNTYDIYTEGEDHTVYIYQAPAKSVGARSIYINENGEKLYSDIVTTSLSGIDPVSADAVSCEYFSLDGQMISRPEKGICIEKAIYPDGTMKVYKRVAR